MPGTVNYPVTGGFEGMPVQINSTPTNLAVMQYNAVKQVWENSPYPNNTVPDQSGFPRTVAPSGTINVGSSGTITLGTALPAIYSGGVFLTLPAIATTPAITAGAYLAVMTSTTVGTLFQTDGTPITFTGGAAFTGVTATTVIETVRVPGKLLGENGCISIVAALRAVGGVGQKSIAVQFGGSTVFNLSSTSAADRVLSLNIRNRGNRRIQISDLTSLLTGVSPSITFSSNTVDTEVDQTITFLTSKVTATECLVLEGYSLFFSPSPSSTT